MPSHARILIIDDIADNRLLQEEILKSAGYDHIETLGDSKQCLAYVNQFEPDLILLDLMMHGMDGFEVLTQLNQVLPADSYLPVLVITADHRIETRQRALALGATDFVLRPHPNFDIILRVRNLLQTRFLHLEVLSRNDTLEQQVKERTKNLESSKIELKLAQLDMIERLALVGEHHDDDTGAHTLRVGKLCRALSHAAGCKDEQVELIGRAAPLHDVGKIGISDAILRKPGKLTPEEFDTMKTHCEIGAKLLSNGRSDMLEMARKIALSHHERWDGNGYPNRLEGEDIPIVGRIVAIADVFDALTHERPYKKAWPVSEAVEEIVMQGGKQFDPEIIAAFCELDHEGYV